VGRDGEEEVFSAKAGGAATEIPLVVLINQFSASGSEVLAAAIQDNERGILMGEKTFGKGTVNIPQKLSDERGALFVTIARWLTPERILIDGVGVRPDIELTLSDEDIDLRRDAQLLSAIDYLRGQQ
jgi:carboxyl-terminal processing protease